MDGNTLTTVLKGLMPSVLYQVEVAAVTSAGVGARSKPVSVLISESPEAPAATEEKCSRLMEASRDFLSV